MLEYGTKLVVLRNKKRRPEDKEMGGNGLFDGQEMMGQHFQNNSENLDGYLTTIMMED